MVRLLLCLCLLTLGSNAYAWYCTYTPTTAGYISNLQCYDIDPTIAIQNYWCPYRNQDPICRKFDQPAIPVCSDRTEVQSVACPIHHSGVINQSRTYYCQSNSYTDWITTSNNCTPDPPTCHTSMETRQVACQEGYTGSIQEVRSSSCPDPYGQPIFGAWVESANSCVKSMTNVTNPVSPMSPISPVSVSPVQEVQQPVDVQSQGSLQTVTESVTPNVTETKTETKTENKQETKTEVKEEKQTEQPKAPDVPKGKELVNGFGVVMSLEIINSPIKFQQQQLEIALEYSQELPDGIRGNQEFLTELISEGSATNLFSIGSKRWADLYRNYEVQPDY
jgi:hypothetical protein